MNRLTDGQMKWQEGMQSDKQGHCVFLLCQKSDSATLRETDRETETQIERKTDAKMDSLTNRQIDRQAGR
jgi:hypothetical protein